jgi:hypothetical protein
VRWAAHSPDAKVIAIDPSRHFVKFDQPEEFASLLGAATSR